MNKVKKKTLKVQNLSTFFARYKFLILLLIVFGLHLFFRVYELESRADFNWDQVDNAWAARRILVEKNYPLIGMQAKLNSGLYIGPLYYYAISPFYALTNLDPIASPLIAAATSILGFWILYFVVSRLFTRNTAIVACILNACSYSIITSERNQWPVNLIAPLFLLLFYLLVKSLEGKVLNLVLAGIVVGLLANVHFSAVFGIFIVVLTLPFLPRTKRTFLYVITSFAAMLLFVSPVWFYLAQNPNLGSGSALNYINSYSHGFHLRRFFQLIHDAFIKFEEILYFKSFRSLSFLLLPLFYVLSIIKTKKFHLAYLTILFFVVPWILFSMYKGEISNYYFDNSRGVAVMVLAVVVVWLWSRKFLLIKFILGLFLFTWMEWNLQQFFLPYSGSLPKSRVRVSQAINQGRHIEFVHGVPDSYLYEIMKNR